MADASLRRGPEPRSPLRSGTTPTGAQGLLVDDLCLLPKVLVRSADPTGTARELGTRFGRATVAGARLMVGSGPDEWFVIGDSDETAGDIGAELASRCTGFVSVIDLTHGRALVRLRGPAVRTVLPRLTAFDLDDRLVPNGAAWRTSLASLVVDLVRDDVDSHPSYLLHCERSSGRYLVDTILAAGADVGATLLAQPRSTWRTPSTSTTG